jgi:hypothetical protein
LVNDLFMYLQFSGESSNQMKASYGAFCSGHLEAVQLYKNLMEKKNFQMFIKVKKHASYDNAKLSQT